MTEFYSGSVRGCLVWRFSIFIFIWDRKWWWKYVWLNFWKHFQWKYFLKQPKTESNKISFLVFSVETRNLILVKWKQTKNVILSKSKNIFLFENVFSMFLFLESRKQEIKSNMFSKFYNFLKMKTIFRK